MKKHRNIFFINGAIIAFVIIWNFIAVTVEKQDQSHNIFGAYAVAGILILILGLLNVLGGLLEITVGAERGKWMLLSGAVILLVGFSVCTIH